MAFIEKIEPVVVNIKLTSKGRELLAGGKFNVGSYALGDSEIDYKHINNIKSVDSNYMGSDSVILRPFDNNPNIISFITKDLSGDTRNKVSNIPVEPYVVNNNIQSIGFFTSDGSTFKTNENYVKQPDVMIDNNSVSGGTTVRLMKSPTYGTTTNKPEVNDLLLVKWSIDTSTTNYNIDKQNPKPYLMYRLEELLSGDLDDDNLMVRVDREIPNFSGISGVSGNSGAMVFYGTFDFSGDTIHNMSSTDYLEESVITFLENAQCPTIIFPYWKLSILSIEDIAGVGINDKKYLNYKNRDMAGFISFIQNQNKTHKRLGVIHYTNQSPSNVYGEGFYMNTASIYIPTIMWHKSTNNELGVRLNSTGNVKTLDGLNIPYYDLSDENGNVVGKVFRDIKIFVIEDQELLFAMSYKSNRSWTLPKPIIKTSENIFYGCPECVMDYDFSYDIDDNNEGSLVVNNIVNNNGNLLLTIYYGEELFFSSEISGSIIIPFTEDGEYRAKLYDLGSTDCVISKTITATIPEPEPECNLDYDFDYSLSRTPPHSLIIDNITGAVGTLYLTVFKDKVRIFEGKIQETGKTIDFDESGTYYSVLVDNGVDDCTVSKELKIKLPENDLESER